MCTLPETALHRERRKRKDSSLSAFALSSLEVPLSLLLVSSLETSDQMLQSGGRPSGTWQGSMKMDSGQVGKGRR